jgi:hypothetical protein
MMMMIMVMMTMMMIISTPMLPVSAPGIMEWMQCLAASSFTAYFSNGTLFVPPSILIIQPPPLPPPPSFFPPPTPVTGTPTPKASRTACIELNTGPPHTFISSEPQTSIICGHKTIHRLGLQVQNERAQADGCEQDDRRARCHVRRRTAQQRHVSRPSQQHRFCVLNTAFA